MRFLRYFRYSQYVLKYRNSQPKLISTSFSPTAFHLLNTILTLVNLRSCHALCVLWLIDFREIDIHNMNAQFFIDLFQCLAQTSLNLSSWSRL